MTLRYTPSNLVKAIQNLPKNQWFEYPAKSTRTRVRVGHISGPEGPIKILRYDPSRGGTPQSAKSENLSSNMLWRVANALREELPINLDRVLGGSYNTRSALEALLLHTPEFYLCYPGRIEMVSDTQKIQHGHKHSLWLPNKPHRNGIIEIQESTLTISEIPSEISVYDAIEIPDAVVSDLDIDTKRRHIQIQIAIVTIGQQLGFRTYLAKNDQGVIYKGKRLSQLPGVVSDLDSEKLISNFGEAVEAARLIDCVWFQNSRLMPAVLEVEHSTGIDSGLLRMKKFKDLLPKFPTRWTIVAPDEDRERVIKKCQVEQFRDLKTRFFPYSAVEELYSLCQRRKLRGVTEDFLDCFMEDTTNSLN